MAQTNH